MSDARLDPQFQTKNRKQAKSRSGGNTESSKNVFFDVILFVLRCLAVQYVHKYHFSSTTSNPSPQSMVCRIIETIFHHMPFFFLIGI